MTFLHIVLVLSTVAVLGAFLAAYLRVRRQLRASDAALREALSELERQRESTHV